MLTDFFAFPNKVRLGKRIIWFFLHSYQLHFLTPKIVGFLFSFGAAPHAF